MVDNSQNPKSDGGRSDRLSPSIFWFVLAVILSWSGLGLLAEVADRWEWGNTRLGSMLVVILMAILGTVAFVTGFVVIAKWLSLRAPARKQRREPDQRDRGDGA
jgi:hypothetical protein